MRIIQHLVCLTDKGFGRGTTFQQLISDNVSIV